MVGSLGNKLFPLSVSGVGTFPKEWISARCDFRIRIHERSIGPRSVPPQDSLHCQPHLKNRCSGSSATSRTGNFFTLLILSEACLRTFARQSLRASIGCKSGKRICLVGNFWLSCEPLSAWQMTEPAKRASL